MEVRLKPDILSLSGSMNHVIIQADRDVTLVLKYASTSTVIVQHTYTPNINGLVEVNLENIITPLLSFDLRNVENPYVQLSIVKQFIIEINEGSMSGTESSFTWTFSVIRAGIDHLADSATNFLTSNFLTWQPTVKPVTYYMPEFLTYYATKDGVVKCKAYVEKDGTVFEKVLVLSGLSTNSAWTIPVQYAIIAGKVGDLPSYYDVWVEDTEGNRLTYIQRYYATDFRSEEEQWVMFENSLGGVDTFRAYGDMTHTAKHTHNIAEIEDESEEYRVDTEREFKKNTGHLSDAERKWLLDFFPSLGKYIYVDSYLRKIVVTDSDVSYQGKELPSNYTFTYKYADARPYLNIPRLETPPEMMDIKVPDVGTFTIAPRLVELQKLTLSGGALFPVQDPYSENWNATTLDAILGFIAKAASTVYKGDGSFGHTHTNISVLDALGSLGKYLLLNGEKIYAGLADEAKSLTSDSDIWNKFLRKDVADVDPEVVTFLKGIVAKAKSYFTGINNTGDIYNTGDIRNDGDVLTRNLTVTGKATFFELEILKAKAAGGMTIESPGTFHVDVVEETDEGWVLYQLAEHDGDTLMQTVEPDDQMFSAKFNIGTGLYTNASNHWYWRLAVSAPTSYVNAVVNGEVRKCLTITLSKTDHDISSDDVPMVGDDLCTLGSRTNQERQSAKVTSVYRSFDPGLDCPYTCQYSGINDYNLTSHRKTWFAANGNRIEGDLVMEGTSKSVKDALDELSGYISEVGDQIDDKIQFWFFPYQPSASNAPTDSWTTDVIKDAHVGDLFYDTARGGSYGGGTCYKWTKTFSEDGTATYAWVEVTDAQTVAALEKIADISSDGVISGGTEHTILHNQWRAAMADYTYYSAQAVRMKLTGDSVYTDFTTAYNDLALFLNGGYAYTYTDVEPDPLFARTSNISKDYRLSEYNITPNQYRNAWNTWSNAVAALAEAIQAATDKKVENLADDGIISAGTEKQQLEQAWARVTSERERLVTSATGFGMNNDTDPAHDTLTTYEDSYTKLAGIVPQMLSELSIGEDTVVVDKTGYQNGWKNYYTAAANMEEALFDRGRTLTDAAQTDADAAQKAIDDIVSDGKLDPSEKQTVMRDFCYYHDERKTMSQIAKCGQSTAPSIPVDVASALSTWEVSFANLAMMLNGGEDWSYTDNITLTNESMPLWLKAENISSCTDIVRDTYRNTWINFLNARTALLNAVTEYARVIAQSAADADYSVNVYVTDIGEGMPIAAHNGDTWKQAVVLTSPYDNISITKDDDGNTLYNVYLCNETYDSSSSGNQSQYWTPISTPTYTAIKKLDDKILQEVIDQYGGSRIESTAKSVSIQVASSRSRNLLKGGWLEYTGWGYGGVLAKQGSRLSVMLEAGKTYTITARGRMPKSTLYVYNRKALVLFDGTTVNTTPVFYYISDTDVQSSVTEYYLATSASSGVTRDTSGWSTSLPTMSDTNRYLWNYRVVVCSNGYSFSSPAVLVHTYTGSAPVGVTEYYLGYTSNSGVSATTDGWSTSPAMPNKVVRMSVHVYNDMSYPGKIIINSTSMSVASHTFTPTVTQTYYIDAFPQDANGANAAYRWREWALEWVVLTAGEVPAAEWTDSEADVLATGFDIKKGEINTTASKFTLSDNNGTKRITSEDGKVVVDFENFKVGADGNVTAINGNFSGTITASSGKIGNLEISQNAIDVFDTNSVPKRVLSPNSIQYYTSMSNRTCLVDVPSPGLMAISRDTSASFIIGKGAISVQLGGYDSHTNDEYKEYPCYTAYIRDSSTTSLSSDYTTMKSIGVGFATNGRMVANVFQSLRGGLAMVAMSCGTVNADGTLGNHQLYAFQTSCCVSSVNKDGVGKYVCTLGEAPVGFWTVLLTARPSNGAPMYTTLVSKGAYSFTVCTSDDSTTNDSAFEYIIVSFGGI